MERGPDQVRGGTVKRLLAVFAAFRVLVRLMAHEAQARDRWTTWHPVYLATGPDQPQPALWQQAGYTPDEATAMLRAGDVPDEDTLQAMAALRREG